MATTLKDLGHGPWNGTYPVWNSAIKLDARSLFTLYYRRIFDSKGTFSQDSVSLTLQLWLRSYEKEKWLMLEALVKIIHTIQTEEDVPLVHPCVILQPACQVLQVIPPFEYLARSAPDPVPITVDIPILFKRIALSGALMGVAGRYLLRYYFTIYFSTMLNVSHQDLAEYGVSTFIYQIRASRSRSLRRHFFELGRNVLWG
nr:putative mating-type 1-2-7 protein [Endoconidiophora polonica]